MKTDKFESTLMRGSLDLMVLSVLADEPLYGYAIQKNVKLASAGKADLAAGTLYPLLHRLESDKLVRSKWDDTTGRKRKWYELTAKGRKRLQVRAGQWQQYAQCMQAMVERFVSPELLKPN